MNNLENEIVAKKCGTIIVDVFKTEDDSTLFYVEPDNKSVLNITNVIENALNNY